MLVLPLGLAWFAAITLALLDGRRRGVGYAAVAALAVTLAALVRLSVDVLRGGPVQMVAGAWPTGVGITLRADVLGMSFAVLSVGVLLVALAYEVLAGVRTRTFPALVLFMATGLTGPVHHRRCVQLLRLLRDRDDLGVVLTTYGERPGRYAPASSSW